GGGAVGFSVSGPAGRACARTAGRQAPGLRRPQPGLPLTSGGAGNSTVPREPAPARPEPGTTAWPPGPGAPTAAAGRPPTTAADDRPRRPRRTVRAPPPRRPGTQPGPAGPLRPA